MFNHHYQGYFYCLLAFKLLHICSSMTELLIILQWVKAVRAGEKAAWNKVYQHYYPVLYIIAFRICKNSPLAHDMVQDAFMTAYLKLPQLKDASAFGSWIKKILIHGCYRSLRRDQTNNLPDVPGESDRWWEDELNRKMDWLSTQSKLYATLAYLPEVLRITVMLRYFSAFQSYDNIANILHIPVGTVRSRLNQAKIKLVEEWQQQVDADQKFLKQCEEWNNFYHTTFSEFHHCDYYKTKLINHLQKDVQIISSGGKSNNGRKLFEKMIWDDRKYGSWLAPANVTSCGNISIIEARHFNSSEYPHHCPAGSVTILYRNKGEVNKMSFHLSS